jgi:hypothetical protein
MKRMSATAVQVEVRNRELDQLDEAIAAGEALLEAKGQLRHGEFGPFIAYCGVSRRSASVYMKLAREKGSAAVLEADSIREALGALGGKRRRREAPPDLGKPGAVRGPRWQIEAWREAMMAEGRDPDELSWPSPGTLYSDGQLVWVDGRRMK